MAGRTVNIKMAAAAAGALAGTVVLGLGVAANVGASPTSSGLPQGSDPVKLDPADFSANIDNRRWPMRVGSRWVYRVTDSSDGSKKRDVIEVRGHHRVQARQAGRQRLMGGRGRRGAPRGRAAG